MRNVRPTMQAHATVTMVAGLRVSSASLPRRQTNAESLPPTEREVLAALLQKETTHPEKPRPILVLTPTDPWMPREKEPEERPANVAPDLWETVSRPPPHSLRGVNSA